MATGYVMENGALLLKMSVCGNSSVGKTLITRRLSDPPIAGCTPIQNVMTSPRTMPTLVLEFDMAHRIVLPDSSVVLASQYPVPGSEPRGSMRIALQIWDTGGCDRWRDAQKLSYRNCHILLAVFDLTRHKTLDDICQWISFALNDVGSQFDPYVVLVGNKLDLAAEQRQISTADIKHFAALRNYFYMETSALDNTGIDALCENICVEMAAAHRAECMNLANNGVLKRGLDVGQATRLIDDLGLDSSLEAKLRVIGADGGRIETSGTGSAKFTCSC